MPSLEDLSGLCDSCFIDIPHNLWSIVSVRTSKGCPFCSYNKYVIAWFKNFTRNFPSKTHRLSVDKYIYIYIYFIRNRCDWRAATRHKQLLWTINSSRNKHKYESNEQKPKYNSNEQSWKTNLSQCLVKLSSWERTVVAHCCLQTQVYMYDYYCLYTYNTYNVHNALPSSYIYIFDNPLGKCRPPAFGWRLQRCLFLFIRR